MISVSIDKRNSPKKNVRLRELFLGADGGGTKTHVVIVDAANETVAEGFAGASNPLRVGVETAISNIVKASDAACDAANVNRNDIVAAALGLAGVGREDLRRTMRASFFKRLPVQRIEVMSDAAIALRSVANSGTDGIVVIAGTGSICMGANRRGETFTAGGWGPIAGDEGGGAGIARRALQTIAKASDGRAAATDLSGAAIEYFRAGRLEDLAVAIYAPTVDNAKIAGFARLVVRCADGGDEAAIAILNEAGAELGLAARAVIEKLKLNRRKFAIGCVGGVFNAGAFVTEPMFKGIRQTAPKAFVLETKIIPARAAARMALENFRRAKNKSS